MRLPSLGGVSTTKALVLGGGGVTGIAWEIGMIAGLAEHGADVTSADTIVGTSAGSLVGAQVACGMPVEELYARQLEDAAGRTSARLGAGAIARFVVAAAWPGDERRGRAWLGRAALAASTAPESEHRSFFVTELPGDTWPSSRRLLVTAVEAQTGEAAVFSAESGVGLIDAVAASCAVPLVFPPVTIGGRRYVDGGIRSVVNADLASGSDIVAVLAPTTSLGLWRRQRVGAQLLRLGPGVRSTVVKPDGAALKAFGSNVLDWTRRAAAARAGRAQAAKVAEAVREVWLSA